MDDVTKRFTFKADTTKHTLIFHPAGDTTGNYYMTYCQLPSNFSILKGKHKNDSIWTRAQTKTAGDYRLIKETYELGARPLMFFEWFSPTPYF